MRRLHECYRLPTRQMTARLPASCSAVRLFVRRPLCRPLLFTLSPCNIRPAPHESRAGVGHHQLRGPTTLDVPSCPPRCNVGRARPPQHSFDKQYSQQATRHAFSAGRYRLRHQLRHGLRGAVHSAGHAAAAAASERDARGADHFLLLLIATARRL